MVVSAHHEKHDGTGYPDGLKGREIPLGARIMSIADAYDSITSERPYRKASSHRRAVKEIISCSGTQFDPGNSRTFPGSLLYFCDEMEAKKPLEDKARLFIHRPSRQKFDISSKAEANLFTIERRI